MSREAEAEKEYQKASEWLGKGDYARAIEGFTKALELDTTNAVAYVNRGYAYQEFGHYEKALADYNKAIKIKPDLSSAYDNRGCLHAALGEIDAAIADHTKALEVDPSNVTAYNNRAVAYGDKGDRTKSISDLDCAIRVDPEYIEGYQLRGFAKYQIGRYREAIVDLTKAIELDKRQPYAPLAHRNGHELPPDFGAVLLSQLPGYGYLRAPGDITPMCLFWRSKAHRCLGKRLLAREDEKKFERLTRTQVKRSFRDRLLDWLAELTGPR